MLSDLILAVVGIFLLGSSVYGLKTKHKKLCTVVCVLALLPTMYLLIANLPVITSPLTSELHGKVIDSETKKPISNINIKAGWCVNTVSAGGITTRYYREYKTKTDGNGCFILPAKIKALTVGFFLGKRYFSGVDVVIYPTNYDYKVKQINKISGADTLVSLSKITSDEEFLGNIFSYWNSLSLIKTDQAYNAIAPEEKDWLKNSFPHFEKIYPNSKAETDSILKNLASIFENIKDPYCIYLLQKIIDKYPNGSLVTYAKSNIEPLKRIYNNK